MCKQIIDLSEWEDFNELHKYQLECDAYLCILHFLLKENYNIQEEWCQYYEVKYLTSYFQLFDYKNKLTNYLMDQLQVDNDNFKWIINFNTKKVTVFYNTMEE